MVSSVAALGTHSLLREFLSVTQRERSSGGLGGVRFRFPLGHGAIDEVHDAWIVLCDLTDPCGRLEHLVEFSGPQQFIQLAQHWLDAQGFGSFDGGLTLMRWGGFARPLVEVLGGELQGTEQASSERDGSSDFFQTISWCFHGFEIGFVKQPVEPLKSGTVASAIALFRAGAFP
jgi:hypothetical protein